MKRLLQALLVLVVIAIVAYWLLIDGVIKQLVETEGSKALKARFDVAAVDFNLFPTVLALRGVAATDPNAPRQNLFTADKIVLRIEAGAALQRQLIAEQAVLHGLRFNQPRAESGAIEGLTPPPTAVAAAPGPQDLQRQQLQTELGKIEQSLTVIRDRWRERLQTLPDEATLAGYRARGATAEINAALAQLRELQTEFERDRAQLQQQLTAARALPQINAGRAAAGAPITQALVGARFGPVLRSLTERLGAPPTTAAPGEWPILARKIEVDGQFDIGGSALGFVGTIDNASPQPGYWRDQPTTFTLTSAAGQPGTFKLDGTLDYRNAPEHSAQVSFNTLPVRDLVLGDDRLRATLAAAVASGQGRFTLRGGQLALELDSRFEQTRFNVTASDDPAAQAAASLLSGTDHFDAQLRASGPVQQPQVAFTSSLDQPLAEAVGRALQQPGAAAGLQAQLQRQLGPELAGIQRLTVEFNALQEELRRRQAALRPAGAW